MEPHAHIYEKGNFDLLNQALDVFKNKKEEPLIMLVGIPKEDFRFDDPDLSIDDFIGLKEITGSFAAGLERPGDSSILKMSSFQNYIVFGVNLRTGMSTIRPVHSFNDIFQIRLPVKNNVILEFRGNQLDSNAIAVTRRVRPNRIFVPHEDHIGFEEGEFLRFGSRGLVDMHFNLPSDFQGKFAYDVPYAHTLKAGVNKLMEKTSNGFEFWIPLYESGSARPLKVLESKGACIIL